MLIAWGRILKLGSMSLLLIALFYLKVAVTLQKLGGLKNIHSCYLTVLEVKGLKSVHFLVFSRF